MARDLPKAHAQAAKGNAAKAHAMALAAPAALWRAAAPDEGTASAELACPVCQATLVLRTKVETQVLSVEQAAMAAGLPANWQQLRPGHLEETIVHDWQMWLEFKKWKEWKDWHEQQGGGGGGDSWHGHSGDTGGASSSSSGSGGGAIQGWHAAAAHAATQWHAEEEEVTTTVKRARRTW